MFKVIALGGACFAFALTTSSADAVALDTRPNLLQILVDDLGYEGLGCFGGLDFSTPNIDRMAAEGVRFSRTYASGVCTPSRVSLPTGLYSTRHRHTGVLPDLVNIVSYMDQLVNRILGAIKDLGIRERTYVVFTADNGTEERFYHNPKAGRRDELAHTRHAEAGNVNGGKHSVIDAETHAPMIWWGPESIPKGAVCNNLVDVVELFPTFCELAGVRLPDQATRDGVSIAAQIHGAPGPPHGYTHSADGEEAAAFDGQWGLKKSGQLIDARALPQETIVVGGDLDSSKARERLLQIMRLLESN